MSNLQKSVIVTSKTTIATRFCTLRKEWLGLTQDQLAARLDCSRAHISRVECGDSEYTYSQIKSLEELCGEMPLNVLLEVTEVGSGRLGWMSQYLKQNIATQHHLDKVMLAALELINNKK